jgi:hypothetical protein
MNLEENGLYPIEAIALNILEGIDKYHENLQ